MHEHEADGEDEGGSEAGPSDEREVGPGLGAGGRRPTGCGYVRRVGCPWRVPACPFMSPITPRACVKLD